MSPYNRTPYFLFLCSTLLSITFPQLACGAEEGVQPSKSDLLFTPSPHLLPSGTALVPARVEWYQVTQPPSNNAASGASFYVNNPITVYGGVQILKNDEYEDFWTLDGDDAIAIYGNAPPPITYYSFILNELSRYYSDLDSYLQTNSSIGLSINQDNIATSTGEKHDAPFVLIISSKYSVADQVKDWFIDGGMPPNSINFMYLPSRFTKQDTEYPPQLNFLARLTFRTDQEHRLAFDYTQQASPSLKAYFFDGPGDAGDVLDEDLTTWAETLRDDDSEWAAGTESGLDMLVDKVREQYEKQGFSLSLAGEEVLFHVYPELMCRQEAITCNYDTPDALYGKFICHRGQCSEKVKDGDLLVIAGVNHHRFGSDELLTYFSYSATRSFDLQGVSSILDIDMDGTARPFLDQTEGVDPDDYFVVTVSRECEGDPTCLEIPVPGNPEGVVGIPEQGKLIVLSRFYLDKVSASGPNPANLVPARLLWFNKPGSP